MTRSAATLLIAALSLAACRDGVDAPVAASPYAPPSAFHESELILFVGDTVDVSARLDLQSATDVSSCSSDDGSIAAIDGALRVVGQHAGDVTIFCLRSTPIDGFLRDDPTQDVPMTVVRYRIDAHVRERDVVDPPSDDPPSDPTLAPDAPQSVRSGGR